MTTQIFLTRLQTGRAVLGVAKHEIAGIAEDVSDAAGGVIVIYAPALTFRLITSAAATPEVLAF